MTLCLLHVCVDIAKVFSSSHFIIRAKGSQKPPSRNAHDDSSPYNIIVDKSTDGCSPTLRFSTQQIRLTQMGFCHMYYGPWNLIFSLSGVTAASCVTDTKEGGVKKKVGRYTNKITYFALHQLCLNIRHTHTGQSRIQIRSYWACAPFHSFCLSIFAYFGFSPLSLVSIYIKRTLTAWAVRHPGRARPFRAAAAVPFCPRLSCRTDDVNDPFTR